MTFPVDLNIPLAPHKPVNDVTPMRTNFGNLVSTIAIDHYSPNVQPPGSTSGTHKQVTYPEYNIPGVPLDPVMIDYTNVGIADASHPQRFTRNSQGIFPMSAIRAFGSYQHIDGGSSFINSFNCTLLGISSGVATITLTTGATNGTNFVVIPQVNNNLGITYSIAANTISITAASGTTIVSFIVLQV